MISQLVDIIYKDHLCVDIHGKSDTYVSDYGIVLIPWDERIAYVHKRLSNIKYILFKILYPDTFIIGNDSSISFPSYIMCDIEYNARDALVMYNNHIIQSYSRIIYPGTPIHLNNQWIGYTSEICRVFPINEYSYTVILNPPIDEEFTCGAICSFDKGRYIWICIRKDYTHRSHSHKAIHYRISTDPRDGGRVYVSTPIHIRPVDSSNDAYKYLAPYIITDQAFPHGMEKYRDLTVICT